MSNSSTDLDRLLLLIDSVCGGTATEDELSQLDALLLADEEVRGCYLDYCQMHIALGLELRAQEAVERLCRRIDVPPQKNDDVSAIALPTSGTSPAYFPILGDVVQGAIGFFSQEVPFALLIATLVTGVGLLAGSMIYVSQPKPIANRAKPLIPAIVQPTPMQEQVGKITGMVACRWQEGSRFHAQGSRAGNSPSPIPNPKSLVLQGDRFALASGLLEITYDSGAKVILEGPVTYVVESRGGGFLSVGKLTARLGKRADGGRRKAEDSNLQSLIPNPSLSTLHSPLFTIKTPSATVTDLGTEFGVEVPNYGNTRVSVFEGAVECQSIVDSKPIGKPDRLIAGQVANIIPGKVAVHRAASPKTNLVRQMPRSKTSSVISLADLVAGGTGFGSWNNWGINPLDANPLAKNFNDKIESSGKFEPYSGDPQIDGVFIPQGGDRPVQIDSAGHTFRLPKTRGVSYGPIWVSQAAKLPTTKTLNFPHRMLLLHANVGITFNLAAINATAPGQRAVRFQSTVAYQPPARFDPKLTADVWVFVDGQLRFSRVKLRNQDGLCEIEIPLQPNDRFLTLVTTDGGDGGYFDYIQHHDPRLVLEPISEGK